VVALFVAIACIAGNHHALIGNGHEVTAADLGERASEERIVFVCVYVPQLVRVMALLDRLNSHEENLFEHDVLAQLFFLLDLFLQLFFFFLQIRYRFVFLYFFFLLFFGLCCVGGGSGLILLLFLTRGSIGFLFLNLFLLLRYGLLLLLDLFLLLLDFFLLLREILLFLLFFLDLYGVFDRIFTQLFELLAGVDEVFGEFLFFLFEIFLLLIDLLLLFIKLAFLLIEFRLIVFCAFGVDLIKGVFLVFFHVLVVFGFFLDLFAVDVGLIGAHHVLAHQALR